MDKKVKKLNLHDISMKNLFCIFLLLFFGIILVLPNGNFAQAQTPQECCLMSRTITVEGSTCWDGYIAGPLGTGGSCSIGAINCRRSNWPMLCLLSTIYRVTDWAFFIVLAMSTVMVIAGGVMITTAGGDPGKVTTGRNYITYAMLGLLVALLSKAIPAVATALLG